MGNMLSHGLLAGALMALTNLLLGLEPMSWNVFLAGIVAILLNLDSGASRIAPGSPFCHSLGFGFFMLYLAGVGAYFASVFFGIGFVATFPWVLAIGIGIFAHLIAEAATGEPIFTVPKNLRPISWLVDCGSESTGFWCAWGRFSLKRWVMRDSHLNGISLALILATIGLF